VRDAVCVRVGWRNLFLYPKFFTVGLAALRAGQDSKDLHSKVQGTCRFCRELFLTSPPGGMRSPPHTISIEAPQKRKGKGRETSKRTMHRALLHQRACLPRTDPRCVTGAAATTRLCHLGIYTMSGENMKNGKTLLEEAGKRRRKERVPPRCRGEIAKGAGVKGRADDGNVVVLKTRFTKRYKVTHPLILAPMGGCAGGALAASVSSAGALGLVGSGGETVEHLTVEWEKALALRRRKVEVGGEGEVGGCSTSPPMGFGVNVSQISAGALAEVVALLKPSHVYLSFGDDVRASGHAEAVGRVSRVRVWQPSRVCVDMPVRVWTCAACVRRVNHAEAQADTDAAS